MKLQGKCAIITGGSRGLGLAIAESFIREGASILICSRDADQLEASRTRLEALSSPGQRVLSRIADVATESEIRSLVGFAVSEFQNIDCLVNNAGIQGPIGPLEECSSEEWIHAVSVHLFGVFYTCKYVLPHMKAAGRGKIINLSGGGATGPRAYFSAYGAAKTAVVRLTETLSEECQGSGIDINAIAPGSLNTSMLKAIIEAGEVKAGTRDYQQAVKQSESGGTPLLKAASLCVFLASSESDGITGRLLSAVWDPWKALPEHAGELAGTDIYTLRRIVARERGKNWEDHKS